MSQVELKIMRLPHGRSMDLPQYQTEYSAGMDLPAAVERPVVVDPGQIVMIPTGLAMAIPKGYEGQVRPRSGLAIKQGLTVVNAPGTIDADYRGEVKVGLVNLGQEAVTINRGDRVAQLIIAAVTHALPVEVDTLSDTTRGSGGFGHTGK